MLSSSPAGLGERCSWDGESIALFQERHNITQPSSDPRQKLILGHSFILFDVQRTFGNNIKNQNLSTILNIFIMSDL